MGCEKPTRALVSFPFLSDLKREGNNHLLLFRAVGNVINYMAFSRLHLVLLITVTVNLCPCP